MNDSLRQRIFRFEWEKAEPLHAAICLPAIVIPLWLGVHYGLPGTAVLIAGGANCVGFGSFQKPLFWRWGPMLIAAFGIGISGAVGVLASGHPWVLTTVVVLWSFLYGLLSAIGPSSKWVGLQCCVYMVISATAARSFMVPEGLWRASMLRGGGLLAGGLLQFLFIVLMWRWIPRSPSTFTDPVLSREQVHTEALWRAFTQKGEPYWFAVQVAITALLSMIVFQVANFNNAYWIPMTALLVPREGFYETTARGLLRVIGTLLGAGLSTLVAVLVHPAGETLAVLVGIFLFGTYWLQNTNYGVFALSLTGYIVFILAIVHAPERATVAHRIEATLIGGAIALLVHYIFHLRRRRLQPDEEQSDPSMPSSLTS